MAPTFRSHILIQMLSSDAFIHNAVTIFLIKENLSTPPLSKISLNIFLFINTDTIHVNINIFQLGFRKKSKDLYESVSHIFFFF